MLGSGKCGGGDIAVDCDFPGGNIIVKGIEGDTVRLDCDLRDTAGSWFAWHFRVCRVGGRTLRFEFADKLIGLRGPAVSVDGGLTWRWLDRGAWAESWFEYAFGRRDDDVRFCFTIPYVQGHLERFLDRHAGNKHLRREVLCISRKGREVPLLRVGRLDGRHEHRLLFTCRHHACESVANYVLEGILVEALSEKAVEEIDRIIADEMLSTL